MENQLTVPWWVPEKRERYGPIVKSIEGVWRLTAILEYDDEMKRWLDPLQELWGPKDYVLEKGSMTIHTPDYVKSVHYDFIPEKRTLSVEDVSYFIHELTDNELLIYPLKNYGAVKFTLSRIDASQLHEPIKTPHMDCSELSGLWWINAEYELAGGAWRLKTDCRQVPGMQFWKIKRLPYWEIYEFGRSPQTQGDMYRAFNDRYRIFRRRYHSNKSDYYHPEKDEHGYWIYVLDSMTGDYRDSRLRLHLTPLDPAGADLFVKSLLWAESERHQKTAADKIPLELLRLWCVPNPEEMAKRIEEDRFFDEPSEYRSEEYAGVYVYLHHYYISVKEYDPSAMAKNFLLFQEILRRWLDLYDRGKILKYIYPFYFKEYSKQLAALREPNPVNFGKRDLTVDLLKNRLLEIQSTDHYIYAFLSGVSKEEFIIYRHSESAGTEERYTIDEFLAQAASFQPDDPIRIQLLLHREEGDGLTPISQWVLYTHTIKQVMELSPENLKNIFDDFLEFYCEKCLRNNRPFSLTHETISRFGFTEEDVRELQPRIDLFHEEIKSRLRAMYDDLAKLDFLRNDPK